MYTQEDLKKYKYFDGADLTFVLDSLTGVISRQYILDMARSLVESNTPFAMCMMDLDNFKYINDSYGHEAGDECLKTIADGLIKTTGDDGIVGRFGGDEFIILYLKSAEYDILHRFFERMYDQTGAVRKSIYIGNVRVFVTATIGCASFPRDATTYEELFLKMDKALYRGKSKGRNCYIIYVHEKHKDIVVNERGTNSLLDKTKNLQRIVETNTGVNMINQMVDYLYRVLHPKDLYFVYNNNMARSAFKSADFDFGHNIYFILDKMVGDKGIFPCSTPDDVKKRFPETADYLTTQKIHAFVIVRVSDFGFICLFEDAVTRMWQDYDLVLLNFAATLIHYNVK